MPLTAAGALLIFAVLVVGLLSSARGDASGDARAGGGISEVGVMFKRALSAIAVRLPLRQRCCISSSAFGGVDGGGTPRLRFVVDNDTQADVVARHREAQRRELAQGVARGDPVEADVATSPSSQAVDVDRVTSADSSARRVRRTRPTAVKTILDRLSRSVP